PNVTRFRAMRSKDAVVGSMPPPVVIADGRSRPPDSPPTYGRTALKVARRLCVNRGNCTTKRGKRVPICNRHGGAVSQPKGASSSFFGDLLLAVLRPAIAGRATLGWEAGGLKRRRGPQGRNRSGSPLRSSRIWRARELSY